MTLKVDSYVYTAAYALAHETVVTLIIKNQGNFFLYIMTYLYIWDALEAEKRQLKR